MSATTSEARPFRPLVARRRGLLTRHPRITIAVLLLGTLAGLAVFAPLITQYDPMTLAVTSVPRRLDDAARTLGRGRMSRLMTVELPLMAPGLARWMAFASGLPQFTKTAEASVAMMKRSASRSRASLPTTSRVQSSTGSRAGSRSRAKRANMAGPALPMSMAIQLFPAPRGAKR